MHFTETALRNLDDPVRFAWRYTAPQDREVAAFLASSFAFGNVPAMLRALERLFAGLSPSPHQRLLEGTAEVSGNFQYRYVRASDVRSLFAGLSRILQHHGSLGALVRTLWEETRGPADCTRLRRVMAGMYQALNLPDSHPLVAHPDRGSALKRWCLFFRWMVRQEPPDLGLWTFIPPSALCIPLDVHIFRMSRRMGWTRRANPDWKAVEEIMTHLRELDPEDPVGRDFIWYREERLGRLQAR